MRLRGFSDQALRKYSTYLGTYVERKKEKTCLVDPCNYRIQGSLYIPMYIHARWAYIVVGNKVGKIQYIGGPCILDSAEAQTCNENVQAMSSRMLQ